MFKNLAIFLVVWVILTSCSTSNNQQKNSDSELPYIEREFRGAWVATVANINWPARPGMPVDSQKIQAIAILDSIKSMNFNAVIFQARPQADALYKSDLEPWSYYLTGVQGQAPEPFYDPLEFWIQETHKRGMDLHVWVNPYRAHHKDGGPISDSSMVKKMAGVVHELSSGYYWFEPTHPLTQDHSYDVIMDIVRRYNIDGLHMDDYFYPYPSYNDDKDFPDEASYYAYQKEGGKLSKGDWRRDAVNKFIKRLYTSIKKEKPYVQFGISPFGIWRPGYPQSIKGFDQYEKLYADAKLWLNEGWVDYFAPQLYWDINRIPQSFPVLLGWWEQENKKHRHLWPGISVGRKDSSKMADETINQIMITRGMLPNSPGIIHWSIAPHLKFPIFADELRKGPYKNQALIPASPWIDKSAPKPAQIKVMNDGDSLKIEWTHQEKENLSKVVVYKQYDSGWEYEIYSADYSSVISLSTKKAKQVDIPVVAKPQQIPQNVVQDSSKTLENRVVSDTLRLDKTTMQASAKSELNSVNQDTAVKTDSTKMNLVQPKTTIEFENLLTIKVFVVDKAGNMSKAAL
jgi:uncharacterized lipoprotein YddW (UPF0748 family)